MNEILATLAATLSFIPVMVCTGYLLSWLTDLNGFRSRSVVERLVWSVPISIAVSTIGSVLIGRFLSLNSVVVLLFLSSFGCLTVVALEHRQLRRACRGWIIGLQPFGTTAALLVLSWIVICICTLVDIQKGANLYTSLFTLDHSARISWTESVFRTGVPPANPLYFFHHASPLRSYHFWYVVCAVTMKISRLPAQAVMTASCIWSGFAVAAIVGLYLKHFLKVGANLRRQFIYAVLLLFVTGLDICANVFDALVLHQPTRMDLEWWSIESIYSWYSSVFWVPHHVAGLVCCFLAFLLAHNENAHSARTKWLTVLLIGFSLASSFGLSLLVPFGFFLVMVVWSIWYINSMREFRTVLNLLMGGIVAAILLVPYFYSVERGPSSTVAGPMFTLGVRQMIPASGLAQSASFQSLFSGHPNLAGQVARLILLLPSYIIELGFYFLVLLIFVIPAWRNRQTLSAQHRSLLFIALAAFPIISFVRSGFFASNDFGWRAAMILQFPLLLLASEVVANWSTQNSLGSLSLRAHPVLRFALGITLVIGVVSTVSQALMIRVALPMVERQFQGNPEFEGILSHNAFISRQGYLELARVIPPDAVVQFPPLDPKVLWNGIDFSFVGRQVAVGGATLWCGSEAGGDPTGCPQMLARVLPIFLHGSADDARAVCREFGIQYLIVKTYTPVWSDRNSWVWTLKPALANAEFRALDCR